MPFVKVTKGATGGYAHDEVEVRMGTHLQGKIGTTRGIYISFSNAVVAQVGWKVDRPEGNSGRATSSINVEEGVGKDAGFWLITENNDGTGYAVGTSKKESGRAFSMSVSVTRIKHYVLNECPVHTHSVEFTIDEKEHTVLIQCPDWLRYNSLSYSERPPEPKEKPSSLPTLAVVGGPIEDRPTDRKQRRAIVERATRAMR